MRKFIFILYLIFSCSWLPAQNVSSTEQEPEKIFSERIFIHTDRSAYIAGDTIWFKAYIFNGNYAGSLSTDFYIDLIYEKGNVIDSKKLPVTDGMVTGDISLPDSLEHGFYFLRAYTRSLVSQGNKNGVIKAIGIINPNRLPSKYDFDDMPDYRVEFFPESGSIVNDIVNSIIFKATDQFDNGLKVQGFLFNAAGDTITSFKDIDKGIGVFSFTPEDNQSYHAEIVFNSRTKKIVVLPAAKNEGLLLKVAESSRGKVFQVQKTGGDNNLNELELAGFMFNKIVFRESLKFNGNTANGLIPVNNLPAGVLHLAVMGKNKTTYAARSVFVYGQNTTIPLSLRTDTLNFSSKEKNSFTLLFPDSIEGNFSVSVVAYDDKSDVLSNNSISSSLLFDNEKEAPVSINAYNINTVDKQTRSVNDLILVTEKQKPLVEITDEKGPKENYIEVSGNVFKDGTSKLVTEGDLVFLVRTKDSASAFAKATIQPDGSFVLNNLVFDDTARFNYRMGGKKFALVDLKLNPAQRAPAISNQLPSFSSLLPVNKMNIGKQATLKELAEKRKSLIASAEGKTLGEVVVTTRIKRPVDIVNKKYTSGLFSNMNASVFDFINEPPRPKTQNVFDYLQGKVAGLRIERRGGTYTLFTSRANSLTGGLIPVQLYLNEMPVEPEILATVPVSEIALVKYFRAGSNMMSGFGIAGRLVIYTKLAEDASFDDARNSKIFLYKGYNAIKDFTPKDYSINKSTVKDNRITLYWNPDATITAGEKEFRIQFYNSDNAKKFKIVVQGFTYDGKLIDFEKIIE